MSFALIQPTGSVSHIRSVMVKREVVADLTCFTKSISSGMLILARRWKPGSATKTNAYNR